jgi:hypothetical protein
MASYWLSTASLKSNLLFKLAAICVALLDSQIMNYMTFVSSHRRSPSDSPNGGLHRFGIVYIFAYFQQPSHQIYPA